MLWFSNEQSLEEPEARLPPPGDAWAAIPAGAAHLPSSRQSQFSCIPAMLHHRLFPAPSRCTVPVVAGCFWSPPQTWRGSTSRSDSRWQDEVSLVWSVLQQTFKQCFVATISSLELSSALRKITARKRKKKKSLQNCWELNVNGLGEATSEVWFLFCLCIFQRYVW